MAGDPLSAAELAELETRHDESREAPLPGNPVASPDWVSGDVAEIVDLLEGDARLDVDPMPPILKALRRAPRGAPILVKHMWEPQPLYEVWERMDAEWWSREHAPNEWWIYVRIRPA